jgi:hypothetical protein
LDWQTSKNANEQTATPPNSLPPGSKAHENEEDHSPPYVTP